MNHRFQQALQEELQRLDLIQPQRLTLETSHNKGRDFAARLSHSTMRYYYRTQTIRNTHFDWLRNLFSVKPFSYGK